MNKSHGSPYDRGSADRYYGRQFNPHRYEEEQRLTKEYLTAEEVIEYTIGWNETVSRKDWGGGITAPEQSDMPLISWQDIRGVQTSVS